MEALTESDARSNARSTSSSKRLCPCAWSFASIGCFEACLHCMQSIYPYLEADCGSYCQMYESTPGAG